MSHSYKSVCGLATGKEFELARLLDPGTWTFEFVAAWPAGSFISIVARIPGQEWKACDRWMMNPGDTLTLAQWEIGVPVSLFMSWDCQGQNPGQLLLNWSATRAEDYCPTRSLPELRALSERAMLPCSSQQRPGVDCREDTTMRRLPALWCSSCQARQELEEHGY